MTTLTLSEAKAKFSEVIDKVSSGEEILVTRMGKPVARITQFESRNSHLRLGFMRKGLDGTQFESRNSHLRLGFMRGWLKTTMNGPKLKPKHWE